MCFFPSTPRYDVPEYVLAAVIPIIIAIKRSEHNDITRNLREFGRDFNTKYSVPAVRLYFLCCVPCAHTASAPIHQTFHQAHVQQHLENQDLFLVESRLHFPSLGRRMDLLHSKLEVGRSWIRQAWSRKWTQDTCSKPAVFQTWAYCPTLALLVPVYFGSAKRLVLSWGHKTRTLFPLFASGIQQVITKEV